MNDDRERDAERERQLEQLFAHAQPRPEPPADDTEEIRRAVLTEWDTVTGRRIARRRAGLAAGAAAMLAIALYVGGGREPTPAPLVASVERAQGTVESGTGSQLTVGGGLVAGTEIVTREGQLALRLTSGGSLRVAAQSRVVLVSGDEAELVAGILYFDSEGRRGATEFTVTTKLGQIRDVGTQFFVHILDNDRRLDVGVRAGRVILARDGMSRSAVIGERLVATEDNAIQRESLATFGADWEWAERVAPPFDIDGRTVSDFLQWFAAQTGRTIDFVDAEAERLARDTVLNGSIDLEPMRKLAAVDALTDLTFEVEGGRVLIRAL